MQGNLRIIAINGYPMAAPEVITELVERFRNNEESYKGRGYNEAQLRREFIDPMFRQLGWDIDNVMGYAEAYKDVIHEDSIKIGTTSKAPDYAYRIGGTRKFFLEAKKPAVDIEEDVDAAYQLRRYAWSAKLSLSVLTNFKGFAVYDCRIKPEKGDKASVARVLYIPYADLAEKWGEISSIFSREAILKGSFDKYATDATKKRGTTEVDDAFLEDIEVWRQALSKNIHLRNPELGVRDLNAAVQKTLDRLIFLRIAEDRGMEPYGRLRSLLDGKDVYSRLGEMFKRADERYNSGLFHFRKNDGSPETLDTFTLQLVIDDAALKAIVGRLYYPESPYEFSVLPADILGQIYERFLGKVIRLAGSRVHIEEKPEVKKAGGVYYTPTYIVNYMVSKTLAPLLVGRTPAQVSGEDRRFKDNIALRVLDPACGSGSFLIQAYQYLLDWYRDRYVDDGAEKHARARPPRLHSTSKGEWKLTIGEKKRILLAHIYGVDIDPQAVEVTKLSLLLKVLEGESGDGIARQMDMFHTRPLPDLGSNIKCGNSLMELDFYNADNMDLFDDEERIRINAFTWRDSFGFLESEGGFSAVLGNPPYIFARELMKDHEKEYYRQKYKLSVDKQNTFMLFMEQITRLLRSNGRASFIVPNSWLTIESAKLLRELYIPLLTTVVDMNYPAFRGVAMEPTIFVSSGSAITAPVETLRISEPSGLIPESPNTVPREDWQRSGGRIYIATGGELPNHLLAIEAASVKIGEIFDVRTGLQAYEKGKGNPPQTAADVAGHVFDRDCRVDRNSVQYLQGADVGRYETSWSGMWMQYGPWLSQPREPGIFTRPRVLIREITGRPPHCIHATYVDGHFLNNKSVLNVLHDADNVDALKCLVAVLNSTAFSVYYKSRAVKGARTVFPKLLINNLRELPYPKAIPKQDADQLVRLVDQAQGTRVKMAAAKTEHAREMSRRSVEDTDKRIDTIVFGLFGFSDADAKSLVSSVADV